MNKGKVRTPKEGEKFKALLYVQKLMENIQKLLSIRVAFEKLTPIYPTQRLTLETNAADLSLKNDGY